MPRDRCISLDVLKKVNMVQGQQDDPLSIFLIQVQPRQDNHPNTSST